MRRGLIVLLKPAMLLKRFVLGILFRYRGESIFSREWDNLIILDACRYDTFKEVIEELNINYGKLEKHISLGSDTTEFLQKNFNRGEYDDIVYVTANPFVSIILEGKVYKIVPVWELGWHQELKTVPPENVVYYALRAYLKYARMNKRLIIHFIQPHYPYVSYPYKLMQKALEDLKSEAKEGSSRSDFSLPLRFRRAVKAFLERKIYHARFYIEIDKEAHMKAYKDNLRYVLPYAFYLAKLLPGKNVITADHGEAFGEKLHPLISIAVFGHLPEIHIPTLVQVPWYIIENKVSKEQAQKLILKEIIKFKLGFLNKHRY